MATVIGARIGHDTLSAGAEGTTADIKMNKLGYPIIMDFYTQMVIEGRVYQVRAGTVTTPLVGDVAITDTAAEMCADAASGTTIIPAYCNIAVRLATGTLHEHAGKSVATVSSSGTAFVPLNLKSDGAGATSTARVAAAGGVAVTAELATTTLRHFAWSQPLAAGAYTTTYEWEPRTPPVLVGPRCFYVQIAATTTGPSYYASFDYIELPTANIS